MKNRNNSHDKLIDLIQKHLDGYIETNRKYTYKGKKGECDVFLLRKGIGYLFEIKTTYSKNSYKKAKEQLQKDYQFYKDWFGIDEFYSFMVHWNKDRDKYQVHLINHYK